VHAQIPLGGRQRCVAERELDRIELGAALVGQLGVRSRKSCGATSESLATQRHTPWLVRSPVRLSPLLTPRKTGPVVSPPAAAHWSIASFAHAGHRHGADAAVLAA